VLVPGEIHITSDYHAMANQANASWHHHGIIKASSWQVTQPNIFPVGVHAEGNRTTINV
jgi:hypothetical protein